MKIIIDGKAAEVSVSGGGLPEGTVAIKPLTKAEYDALTDEEKQADVAYAITDDAGSGGGSGGTSEEIYSTEETRIGTWVDGKPLYRLVFDSYIPDVASSPRLLGNVTDMDTMVYAYGRIRASNTNFVDWPIPNYVINLMKQGIGVYGMVMGSYVTEWSGKPITVIVEYTKTTDEATS